MNGANYTVPDGEFKKIKKERSGFVFKGDYIFTDCDLSIGVYKIDLKKMEQTNLFSEYKRRLYLEEIRETIPSNFQT